ncbi:MAG: DUF4124 domain-containing protein [Gammaproteobacteria bacterium]|jgi:hypothetical protein|nr:DUF4124 domain-containing protein [Gammaproteobacteria bacterium]
MKTRIMIALMLAGTTLPGMSEVIRSVDKDGNVTFSDQPVPGSISATPVTIDAYKPSPREASESEQQAQETIQRADQLQRQVDAKEADKAARINAAQVNLDSATAHLQEVQVVREGDRQALAGGGTKLRPQYLQRVQEAEQQVIKAQEQLDAARMAR